MLLTRSSSHPEAKTAQFQKQTKESLLSFFVVGTFCAFCTATTYSVLGLEMSTWLFLGLEMSTKLNLLLSG